MQEKKPSNLDRVMRLFSEVRAGESVTALLLLLNLFLILVAYYVIKTVREPLILATGGAELKTYAAGVQALVLVGAVPAYGWLTARVHPRRLVFGVTLFFIVCIELCFLAAMLDMPMLGFVFYVWVGIFSLAIIAQFWSYANDLYPTRVGERLFPLIAVGATVGSAVGSLAAAQDFASVEMLMQVAAVLLLVTMALYWLLGRRPEANQAASPRETPLSGAGGFTLVLRSSYIRLIALLLIVLNLVNTTGEYILSTAVIDEANEALHVALLATPGLDQGAFVGAFIKSFYGQFFFWVNIATVAIQAFIVSRIVKYAGIRGVLLALPIVAAGAYSLVAAGVAFHVLRWAKTAENSTDYSVMNTAKAMLWLPTSADEKYKAKLATDTFFVRLGDVTAALLVFVGTEVLSFEVTAFAVTNVALVLVAAAVAWLLYREYAARSASEEATRSAPEFSRG